MFAHPHEVAGAGIGTGTAVLALLAFIILATWLLTLRLTRTN